MAKNNQAPPTYANAANRLAALQAKAGGDPTKKQQRVMTELQRRVGVAGGTPTTLPGLTQQQGQISGVGGNLALEQLQNGGFQNPFNPQVAPRISDGDLMGLRDQAYNTQYDYLTRDLGQQEAQAGQDVSQQLADRGITYSNDPNSQYQQQMKDYQNRFDRARLDARAQASQFAGQEAQSMFGMNEQMIANQYQQAGGVNNQRLNEISVLSGLGQPGYAGYSTLQDVDQARRLQNQQFNKGLNKQGGGGSTQAQEPTYAGSGAFAGL